MDVFAALADPVRRQLLVRLAGGTARVVELAADHRISRPAISRHLRLLEGAGLVSATERGRERHYALRPEPLREVRDLLDQLGDSRPPITEQHLDALETEVRRTSRARRAERSASSNPSNEEHIA